MRRRFVLIAACAAAFVLPTVTAPTGASAAACAPDAVTINDANNDGKYLAPPEIAAVTASVDASCTLLLSDAIANRPSDLGSSDRLYWWLDTDNNASTGRPAGPLAGVEYGLILTSNGQAQLVGRFGEPLAPLPAAGPFAVSVAASAIGATETSAIRIVAYSQTAPPGQIFTDPPGYAGNYFDYAQRPGDPPFVLQLQPAAVPSAPPPSPVPTTVTPSTQCVVPQLRGLASGAARAKLADAHCALGAVHRRRANGRVGIILSTTPAAGTTAASGTKVAITVRARPR